VANACNNAGHFVKGVENDRYRRLSSLSTESDGSENEKSIDFGFGVALEKSVMKG
jgi:hypothetical protein